MSNLTVRDADFKASGVNNMSYAGGICGVAKGGFEQCLSVDNIILNGSFGGGLDEGDSTFTNCGVSRCTVLGFSNTGSNSISRIMESVYKIKRKSQDDQNDAEIIFRHISLPLL